MKGRRSFYLLCIALYSFYYSMHPCLNIAKRYASPQPSRNVLSIRVLFLCEHQLLMQIQLKFSNLFLNVLF